MGCEINIQSSIGLPNPSGTVCWLNAAIQCIVATVEEPLTLSQQSPAALTLVNLLQGK
jgi:ubiquitin C-terminal hydrolase